MMSGGVLIQSSGVSLTTLKDGKMIEFDSASVARVTPEQADELLNREQMTLQLKPLYDKFMELKMTSK